MLAACTIALQGSDRIIMAAPSAQKLESLRRRITESLRVQRETDSIEYIDVGHALNDATSRQNHAIFARRGCGKTLLLRTSAAMLSDDTAAVYLNCENFKRHSFPNVLIEILRSLFTELSGHLIGWFGRKHKSKQLVDEILLRLNRLQAEQDVVYENIKALEAVSQTDQFSLEGALKGGPASVGAKAGLNNTKREEIERTYKLYREKIEKLDIWLPELKRNVEAFLQASKRVKVLIIQIDDLYHLKRTDQAFVVDYIHRLCKDLPLYFKLATLRHASTLYVDRQGQPIGAQERHDYQSINIDYTFGDFQKTSTQNWKILLKFAADVKMSESELNSLFKGEGWARLVMAGGGVPRDVLSLFLDILSQTDVRAGGRIGKDEIRLLSKANFERRIEELKQDSQEDEQVDLLRGIYLIREFCFAKKTNIFLVRERDLQQNDQWRALFYRLLDYRIIHQCASTLTHKSTTVGNYSAFAIDIGCYAHLRKHTGRFSEIDVSDPEAKDKMRSAPILEQAELNTVYESLPDNIEEALTAPDESVGDDADLEHSDDE